MPAFPVSFSDDSGGIPSGLSGKSRYLAGSLPDFLKWGAPERGFGDSLEITK